MVDNKPVPSKSRTFFSLSVVVVILVAIFLSTDYAKPTIQYIQTFMDSKSHGSGGKTKQVKLFTKAELSKFTGDGGQKVYLALLGEVFDVTKGAKHYGIGGGYHFFAGKDGTRAFVSGDFTEAGLIEDTSGLSSQDILGLEDWKKFYHKDYTHIGKLIGLYYDEEGKPTAAHQDYLVQVEKAVQSKQSDEDDRLRFPPCNFEYKQGQGRRIWCSTLSGGVKRDWEGVPRQYFRAGKTEPRCACVKDFGAPNGEPESDEGPDKGDLDNPSMKLYEGCDPNSFQCFFKE